MLKTGAEYDNFAVIACFSYTAHLPRSDKDRGSSAELFCSLSQDGVSTGKDLVESCTDLSVLLQEVFLKLYIVPMSYL